MTQNLILDSTDQKGERGITILAKNTSILYKKIDLAENDEAVKTQQDKPRKLRRRLGL